MTGTIGNNGFWPLSLSQTSVNISTWYYTFHLVPEQVPAPAPAPVPCSINIPLLYAICAYFIEAASSEVVGDDGESIRGSLQLVVEVIVQVLTLLLSANYIENFPVNMDINIW